MASEENISTDLIQDLLKEKRADRRWKNIRFIAWFVLIIFCVFGFFSFIKGGSPFSKSKGNGKYVAFLRLDGMIAPGKDFSAEEVVPILQDAYSDNNVTGLLIDINSGGGTPVQASLIHDAIIQLKNKYHKKTIIVGEDLLTSGAYFVAIAADKIYVNPNTITGSIGVIMKGFGFVDLIKKLGIERRVYVAGNNKDRLDPFLPQTPDDMKKIGEVITEVHNNFTQAVLTDRKGKLKGDPSILFSGDFWSGQTALTLGLVDALGSPTDALYQEFHTDTYKEIGNSHNLIKMLAGQVGTTMDKMMYF